MKRLTSRLVALLLLVLAIALSTRGDIAQRATEVPYPCPWGCSLIDYGSISWYVWCWPAPKSCAADGAGGGTSGAGL